MNNKSANPQDPDPFDPQETARGETVEFSYPLNGADLGFFKPRDQPANAVPKVTVSAQTTFVKVLYTSLASRHGTELGRVRNSNQGSN